MSNKDAEDDDRPFLKSNVYFAAKDGLALAMYALLSSVDDEKIKNSIINEVRNNISALFNLLSIEI